jgi:hypothetical protein
VFGCPGCLIKIAGKPINMEVLRVFKIGGSVIEKVENLSLILDKFEKVPGKKFSFTAEENLCPKCRKGWGSP